MSTETSSDYVSFSNLFQHVNKLRIKLGLPKLKTANSMCTTLKSKKVPFIMRGARNKLYHLESALKALTHMKHRLEPWNRLGTKKGIDVTRIYAA